MAIFKLASSTLDSTGGGEFEAAGIDVADGQGIRASRESESNDGGLHCDDSSEVDRCGGVDGRFNVIYGTVVLYLVMML